MLSSTFLAKSTSFLPPTICDARSIRCLTRSRIRTVIGAAMMEPRYLLIAPTLGAIDMPLSFSTTMMSRPESPALLSASYGSPHVIAPQETRQPAPLAQRLQPVVAAREDLPRIALVPDVPHDLVAGRLERGTKRHRQIHDTQPGAYL